MFPLFVDISKTFIHSRNKKKEYQKGTSHSWKPCFFQQNYKAEFFSLGWLTNYSSFRILSFIAADFPYFAMIDKFITLLCPFFLFISLFLLAIRKNTFHKLRWWLHIARYVTIYYYDVVGYSFRDVTSGVLQV